MNEGQKDPWPLGSPKFDTHEDWLHAAKSYGTQITIMHSVSPEGDVLEKAVIGDAATMTRHASIGEWQNGVLGRLLPNKNCQALAEMFGGLPKLYIGVIEERGVNRLYLSSVSAANPADDEQDRFETEHVKIDTSRKGQKDDAVAKIDMRILANILRNGGVRNFVEE